MSPIYSGTSSFINETLKRFGVEVTFVDVEKEKNFAEAVETEYQDIYFETIANPTMAVPDVLGTLKVAEKHKILTSSLSALTLILVFIVDYWIRISGSGLLGRDSGFLGPDSGLLGRDSGFLGPDSGFLGPDSGFLGRDSGFQRPDSGFLGRDSGFMGRDSGFLGPDSGFLGPDSGFLGRDSGFLGRDSGFLGPDSGFLGRDSGFRIPRFWTPEPYG
ncbi:unnamed protein product [Caenorhabditis nigoni]